MEGAVPSIKYSGYVEQAIKACTKLLGKAVSYSLGVYVQEMLLLGETSRPFKNCLPTDLFLKYVALAYLFFFFGAFTNYKSPIKHTAFVTRLVSWSFMYQEFIKQA